MSIIVVNYNVEYFLDQCLHSVQRALDGVSGEIIVVDNNSTDGSLKMLSNKYPGIKIIANKENTGFSRANNQGISIAGGEYILLLNPDTVVEENTFKKVIAFMDSHPEAGGLGARMIDGKGNFLPESKRGLPTPSVAFYSLFRLSRIFPKSKRFNQYHLSYLPENETNEVDVLSGAFMLIRKNVLDKVGLLDETFFMYGEDVDLSYRIQLGGYKNYYFPEVSIIHYKGESTKKSSVNYVYTFYKAMAIFAKKHFSDKHANIFGTLINIAIFFRAILAVISRVIKSITLPLFDFAYLLFGLLGLTNYWRMSSIEFPENVIHYAIPVYLSLWIFSLVLNGGYDRPVRLIKYLKGILTGTVIILIGYALLPKDLQFSRLFIIVGTAWLIIYFLFSRIFLHFAIGKSFRLNITRKKRFIVLGSDAEFDRVKEIIRQTNENIRSIEHIDNISKLKETKQEREIVFCSRDLTFNKIISGMSSLKSNLIDFKIAPPDANFLIGSNSIDSAGDLYIMNLNTLVSPENKRKKRILDLFFSFGLILCSPVLMFLFQRKKQLFKNLFNILYGKMSFIGFSDEVINKDIRLPRIKKGILSPADALDSTDSVVNEKLNLIYSRDYSMRKDFLILMKAFSKLDRLIQS